MHCSFSISRQDCRLLISLRLISISADCCSMTFQILALSACTIKKASQFFNHNLILLGGGLEWQLTFLFYRSQYDSVRFEAVLDCHIPPGILQKVFLPLPRAFILPICTVSWYYLFTSFHTEFEVHRLLNGLVRGYELFPRNATIMRWPLLALNLVASIFAYNVDSYSVPTGSEIFI